MASGSVQFSQLCACLNDVVGTTSKAGKAHALDEFFHEIAEVDSRAMVDLPPASRCESDLSFAVMRLVLPELDKERASYGMREKSLGDMYSQLLQLPRGSATAERLRRWKDPNVQARTGGKVTAAGDFCAVLGTILEGRCSSKSELSVQDVNDLLDQLNQCEIVYSAGGFVSYRGTAGEERRKILHEFLKRATAVENVWITKIILKDMKIGIGYEAVLRWYHPSALMHYKGTHNLALVCKECHDPDFVVEDKDCVTLGAPAEVLLCHRLKDSHQLQDVVKAMPTGFFLEPKYDGERLQLHKIEHDIRCFSRNAIETTHLFGNWLRAATIRSVLAVDCILDGEVLLWNNSLNAFEKFERIRGYVSGSERSEDIWVKYVVFDVLYVDQRKGGEPSRFLSLPHRQRLEVLEKIIAKDCNVISVAPSEYKKSVSDIFTTMEHHISNKYEGVVIKNPNAKYVLGGRDIKLAVKLKPDYLDGGLDDLDMLILGGFYGNARSKSRRGRVSHFVVGVRDDSHVDPRQDKFVFVTRVGSGYSADELHALDERLSQHWIALDSKNPPDFIASQRAVTGMFVPDVVIDPRASEVLQIKAYALNYSEESPSGVTMRFPRVKRLRPDRGWKDAMSMSELRKYAVEQSSRTYNSVSNIANEHRRKRRKRSAVASKNAPRLLAHFV
mmetsp:Transcript_35873/g.143367  ORF Transcript_35873/g.143367 Transcript_35873/m.143367 type:complete len:671 (-) Transcript_35873:2322-4334(-)